MFKRFVMVLLPLAAALIPAHAGIVTYTDFASWSAAAGSFTGVTIPDVGAGGFQYFGSGDASVTYSGVTFSQSSALSDGNFFNISPGFSGDPALISSQEQTTGLANILVTFAGPVDAFAFNFGTFGGSDVTFTLSSGQVFVFGSTASGYQTTDFFGVVEDPINFVLITSPDSVLNMNDLLFVPTSTPEPATFLFMIPAALGLVLARKRRTR